MKKNIYIAIFAGLTLSFASCNKFDYEDPTFNKSVYESDREATEANISIKEIKAKYKTAITNNSTSNKITTDEIFDLLIYIVFVGGNYVNQVNLVAQVPKFPSSQVPKFPSSKFPS